MDCPFHARGCHAPQRSAHHEYSAQGSREGLATQLGQGRSLKARASHRDRRNGESTTPPSHTRNHTTNAGYGEGACPAPAVAPELRYLASQCDEGNTIFRCHPRIVIGVAENALDFLQYASVSPDLRIAPTTNQAELLHHRSTPVPEDRSARRKKRRGTAPPRQGPGDRSETDASRHGDVI